MSSLADRPTVMQSRVLHGSASDSAPVLKAANAHFSRNEIQPVQNMPSSCKCPVRRSHRPFRAYAAVPESSEGTDSNAGRLRRTPTASQGLSGVGLPAADGMGGFLVTVSTTRNVRRSDSGVFSPSPPDLCLPCPGSGGLSFSFSCLFFHASTCFFLLLLLFAFFCFFRSIPSTSTLTLMAELYSR